MVKFSFYGDKFMVKIICEAILIQFIFFIIYYLMHYRLIRSYDYYQNPVELKSRVQKEIEKEDKYSFNEFIDKQNSTIRNAMKQNKNECLYCFYERFKQLYQDTYKDEFAERANEYYKKYKIDGDKISWN